MTDSSLFTEYRWLVQSFFTILLLSGYLIILRVTLSLIREWALEHQKHKNRVEQVSWLFRISLSVLLVFVISIIWGVDYKGLWVVTTSVLAVLGVALFAQWSILSNLTSGVIVFFNFPAKVGDTIEIIDGVNSVKGQLIEIGLFQIQLQDKNQDVLVFPNNLLLQKPVKKIKTGSEEKVDIKSKNWVNRKLQKQG
jgi:small-conductance mechanosensitive channel